MHLKIDNNKYQVFILSSRATLPYLWKVHVWLVVNKMGEVHRYEIKRSRGPYGYLHVDAFPPFEGLLKFPFNTHFFWSPKLVFKIEGNETSLAKQVAVFIENSKNNYPYRNEYSVYGKNCGTYVEWVLHNFPEIKIKLPWKSFSKF